MSRERTCPTALTAKGPDPRPEYSASSRMPRERTDWRPTCRKSTCRRGVGLEAVPESRWINECRQWRKEQSKRLPRRTACPLRKVILPTCETTLNHRVIDVFVLGCCDFLGFVGVAGFDFFRVAVAVESDYFHREVFELAVGVERAAEYVHYVGHDFEVLEGFYCAPGRV